MKCMVCGTANHACGGPTTTRPFDDTILVVREKMMPKREDMVRVDRGDGILVNMTTEEAENFEKTKDDRSERTTVYNYAVETQAVGPADSASPDRVVSSRTLRTPPRRVNESPTASTPAASGDTE